MRTRSNLYNRFLFARIVGFIILGECIALPLWPVARAPRTFEQSLVIKAPTAIRARGIKGNAPSQNGCIEPLSNDDLAPAPPIATAASAMDPLSQQLFGSRDVSFQYAGGQKTQCQAFEIFLFGRRLSPLDYTEIVAAPAGATIRVRPDVLRQRLRICVEHPLYNGIQMRALFKYHGKLEMENEQWFVRPDAPSGVATRVVGRQVYMAHRLGVRQIGVYGAGSFRDPDLNGYYTWPRLGFNVRLDAYRDKLEDDGYRDVKDTNDLFGRPGGADWWKRNGKGCYGLFNVNPNSVSSIVLKRYLKAKGAIPYEEAE